MRRPSRRARLLATGGALLFSLVGCGRSGADGGGRPADGTLRVLYASDERSLYPGSDDVPIRLVFSPLVSYGSQEAGACREPEPALAEAWERSADGRTWTVRLREGLTWHDGVPVTAEDVKFTAELWKHPEVRHWAGEAVDSVVVLDGRTFRVHYRRPSRDLLNGWDVFYPAHLLRGLDPAGFWDWGFWERPVGSGPFRYVEHVPGTMMVFEPHAAHPMPPRGIDRLVVKWGGGSAIAELESGAVDAVEGASPGDAARLREDPLYRVHAVSHPGGVWLFWNQRVPPLDRASVRRALTRAIDRRELLRALDLPDDLPISDGLHTPCQFARRMLREPLPFDPEGAAELLASAGWWDRDGDGVRERAGGGDAPEGRLAFTVTVPADWLQAGEAAVYIQQSLRRVGVEVEVRRLEYRAVGERLRVGDFEALIWQAGPWPQHHLERFGSGNPLGFESRELTALLEEARDAVESAVRDSLYRLASAVLARELPATWLYPKVDFHVTRATLTGYEATQGDLLVNLARLSFVGGGEGTVQDRPRP